MMCGALLATFSIRPAGAATGDLDPAFSGDGVAAAPGGSTYATASTVQPDGKLVVAGVGGFDDGSVSKIGTYVARYTTSGDLDPTFGTGGVTPFNAMPAYETVRGIALDPTGRIVLSGYGATTDPSDESDVAVVRLSAAGKLDTTFGGGDGIAVVDMGNHDRAGGVSASGGRILVAASQDSGGNWANEWTVLALTDTGALDASFSGDGKAELPTTQLSTFDGLRAIAVQPDGRILLGGTSGSAFATARLTAAGAPDPSWNGNGVSTATVGTGGAGYSLLLQKDGKVVVGGFATQTGHSDNDFAAVRFAKTGALDPTFGSGGKVAVGITAGSTDRALGAALAADDKIVLAGYTNSASAMNLAVARLNWNGTLDTSFSGDGLVTTDTVSAANEQLEAVAIGPNDRVLGAGDNANGWAVVAYSGGASTNLSVANASVTEPNSGTTNLTFTIRLSSASPTPVTVKYGTKPGTATSPSDFVKRNGTVSFAPGETAKTVSIAVVGDTTPEPDETFKLTLSKPTNAGISRAAAVGTIVDND